MPKSHARLVELGATFFQGHGIVADGTTANVGGVLTGWNELQSGEPGYPLHEARVSKPGASQVDDWPWVFTEMEQKGWVTAGVLGDNPGIDPFSMRLKGFGKQPLDHSLEPLVQHMRRQTEQNGYDQCFDGKTKSTLSVDWASDFFHEYHDLPGFFYSHLSSIHHSRRGAGLSFDPEFNDFLTAWPDDPVLKHVVLIVLADHGSRDATDLETNLQAKLEERSPVLGVLLPKWLQQQHPELQVQLTWNAAQQVPTSPYDMFATIRHLLALSNQSSSGVLLNYGRTKQQRSLMQPIDPNRSCADAGIPAHFCVCVAWNELKVTDERVTQVANAFIQDANKRMSLEAAVATNCHELRLTQVDLAEKLQSDVPFARSVDRDGRSNQIDHKVQHPHYRLEVTAEAVSGGKVIRSGMRYEVHMKHREVLVVLRHDQFGSDPSCIAAKFPHMRELCVCRHK